MLDLFIKGVFLWRKLYNQDKKSSVGALVILFARAQRVMVSLFWKSPFTFSNPREKPSCIDHFTTRKKSFYIWRGRLYRNASCLDWNIGSKDFESSFVAFRFIESEPGSLATL